MIYIFIITWHGQCKCYCIITIFFNKKVRGCKIIIQLTDFSKKAIKDKEFLEYFRENIKWMKYCCLMMSGKSWWRNKDYLLSYDKYKRKCFTLNFSLWDVYIFRCYYGQDCLRKSLELLAIHPDLIGVVLVKGVAENIYHL